MYFLEQITKQFTQMFVNYQVSPEGFDGFLEEMNISEQLEGGERDEESYERLQNIYLE